MRQIVMIQLVAHPINTSCCAMRLNILSSGDLQVDKGDTIFYRLTLAANRILPCVLHNEPQALLVVSGTGECNCVNDVTHRNHMSAAHMPRANAVASLLLLV